MSKNKKLSLEHRKKISESVKKAWYNPEIRRKKLLKIQSLENRKKISKNNGRSMLGKENKWGHHTEEAKRKMSLLHTGVFNPMYGKTNRWGRHTLQTKKIMSIKSKNRWKNKEWREKMLKIIRYTNTMNKKANIKKSISHKKYWKNKEWRNKQLKLIYGGINKKPNKPEKFLISLINKNNMPFNYVGNSNFWINYKNNHFNPDFISKNKKKIIELFGCYYHGCDVCGFYSLLKYERNKNRINIYRKKGFIPIIIWEHELLQPEKIINKILYYK